MMPKLPGVAEVWGTRFQTHSTARDFPGYCVLQTGKLADEDESQSVETLKFAAAEVARLHRESPGASIGILVRRNSAVARMIYELRHTHKIEASEEGGNPLVDSAAVQLVLSLLAIADHPGDSIARFHVANSALGKIVGFTDYQDAPAARRLSSEIRRSLLERGYGATIRQWTRALAPDCNQRELTRLLQLVSLAYRYEDQATEQAQDFIEMVSLTKVEDPKAAEVRVMNIHQSKGLEFDIVVLPELDGQLGGMTPQVVIGRNSPTAPVASVFRYIPKTVLPLLPERFSSMLEVHNQQIHNESLCLLYVAMTRAVHALHLIVAPSPENERSLPRTFAGLLRAGLHEGKLSNPPEQVLYELGDPDWFAKTPHKASETAIAPDDVRPLRIELRPEEKPKGQRVFGQSPSDLEGGSVVEVRQLFREDSVLSRTRGSLWHAWMELVDWLDDPQTPPPSAETLRQLAGQFLHPRLKLEEELTRFEQVINQPAIRQALSRNQYGTAELEIHQEYPIADQYGQGIIDRLVLSKHNGEVMAADILDFKTDRLARQDQKAVQQLGKYYQPQLEAYRAAIEQAFSLEPAAVSARLLFLESGDEWRLA
jgi:ATP-dependent exoDNAse (exonuclease V) beta subunit